MKRVFFILFIAASLGELCSHVFQLHFIHHLCKPLIMVFLGAYYVTANEQRSRWVIAAIFFSFLGDALLMYESLHELYFMAGLGAFLVSHFFYILSYNQHNEHSDDDKQHNIQIARMTFPVLLAGTGLVVVLYSRLGALKIPVIVYAVVLMVMVAAAIRRFHNTSNQSFVMVVVGAILFMVSDSLLAINKFLEPVSNASILIMLTYITAQLLIVEGLIRHGRITVQN
jgi:uncharacterized membrane protein YhhN